MMFELPGGIGQLREVMQTRPRSVGAATLAPTLDAAITLPPRKPRADRLPIGGYADVTTRGDPARLLPSQFALEGDEFVRRFAENELLYFLREEPREPDTPERWLILDQGIRTWGAVRHALTAGVLTLLGKMRKPAGPVQIAVNSCAEPLDPAFLGLDGVAEKLEASDLTRSPADALSRVHAESMSTDSRPRDLILLTHARTFQDPDLQQLFRLCTPNDRMFALTVNDRGDAEWGE